MSRRRRRSRSAGRDAVPSGDVMLVRTTPAPTTVGAGDPGDDPILAVPPAPRAAVTTRRGRRGTVTTAPGTRRFLVLACGTEDVPAIDLATGAVARLRVVWTAGRPPDLSPFDVVDAAIATDPERDDLAQPEAITVHGIPEVAGAMHGRRARTLLRKLLAPTDGHLLGFPGSSWPYWEFHGMRPSVALVAPTRGPIVFRRRADDSVWTRFGWPRSDIWLPVEDRRVIAALWAARRDRLAGKDLTRALGFRPHYLVVTVSRPRQGHCYKTVAAFLPRP